MTFTLNINNYTGAVFHYVIVNMTLWWFFHLCIFLYKIMFPFHAKRAQNTRKQKYLFVVLLIFGKCYKCLIVNINVYTRKANSSIAKAQNLHFIISKRVLPVSCTYTHIYAVNTYRQTKTPNIYIYLCTQVITNTHIHAHL